MISLAEARALIAAAVPPLDAARTPLAEAHGRVLREDVAADTDLPAFDRSAMDGYAVGADDDSTRFRVVAEIQPGAAPAVEIRRGECARIFTGAALPPGAGRVLMQEDCSRAAEWMTPQRRDARDWIRRRGEDARAGEVLLRAGHWLRAGEVSLLAQLGAVQPLVSPRVRVRHFTTGNELVPPAITPGPGQIRDSNSALIAALLAESGAQLTGQARCGDALDTLIAAIESAGAEWDTLLLSGGASVGDYDFGVRALEALGFTIHFRQINLRPGKPLVFATRERQLAFVIPGNPVSHFVTYHVAIRLALECLTGARPSWPLASAELATDLPAQPPGRETFWPARVSATSHGLRVHPLPWQSSGDLRGLLGANALLPLPPAAGPTKFGEPVPVLLLALGGD
ncbi:MAG: molybdopterin molybdotransferase MoeA [Chthoniobacter sp.]|nr:molybdopterin molybdotransferase MoeA [Chthoniobacter sp.]